MYNSCDVDKEWENFLTCKGDGDDSDDEELQTLMENNTDDIVTANLEFDLNTNAPKATDIYISTKTKIAYLNCPVDIKEMFWSVPVIPYAKPCNGIIKKQIKFNSTTQEELDEIKEKLKKETFYEEYIITSINNPEGRIKFKDIRKVSVGISKKDIMSYRSKKKSAFYNCFVMMLRLEINDIFKEFHVKVFNTGKLEIPGIQNETTFNKVLKLVVELLQPHVEHKLSINETSKTVLINSNFNCGFFVNREALSDILKYKYNIQSIYDPCSYPGIQCKFYYNPNSQNNFSMNSQSNIITETNKTNKINKTNAKATNLNDEESIYKKISFMIFRTGSVLIVGKCDESILLEVYEYLKTILHNEYKQICQKIAYQNGNTNPTEGGSGGCGENDKIVKNKKIRRKTITIFTTSPLPIPLQVPVIET